MTDTAKIKEIKALIDWYRFDTDFSDDSRYKCFVEDLRELMSKE